MTKDNAGRRYFCVILILLVIMNQQTFGQDKAYSSIIPIPSKLTTGKGNFNISTATVINCPTEFKNEAEYLAGLLGNILGKRPVIGNEKMNSGIRMLVDEKIDNDEGYIINITTTSVQISAKTPSGMFRAIQTIRQLLPVGLEAQIKEPVKQVELPVLSIADKPVFAWRGLHIDVSRHFFSMEYLKKLIDLMALYKMNKFHLHLTDDQGWRVEIKKYPKLTEEGAWRQFNRQDSVCMQRSKDNPDFIIDPKHIIQKDGKTLYGGFYTQAELRSLVAYAAARHIDIIPEIDMPGHMMAAINSYNFLSCDSTSTFGEFFSTPVCPCNPAVLAFAKDIYTEIMDIFPSEYLHIGGDEVERTHWERSAACKEMMEKYGMKSTAELQSWFIREMEKFFHSKGRKLIGWDEILDGGVSNTAAIMYWRTWVPKAPIEAARNGNKVIMTPGNPLYFSDAPDKNSLAAVYNYDFIPKGLTTSEAKNIIGGQGNLWSEYIPTEQRADYLYLPRMIALAENLWSVQKDYTSFQRRMKMQYKRLDILNVKYRLPDISLLDNYAFANSFSLPVNKPLGDMIIRYTTDGSIPTLNSVELGGNLVAEQSKHVRLAAFKDGRRGDIYDIDLVKQLYANSLKPGNTKSGLTANWYKRAFDSTTVIKGTPDGNLLVKNISVPREAQVASFTLQYRGFIEVPEDGVYTFYLTADDAAVLKIADRMVVNNDGMHPPKEKNGQVALKKGLHAFALDFIEGGGGYTLNLKYSKNNDQPKEIPDSWFKN